MLFIFSNKQNKSQTQIQNSENLDFIEYKINKNQLI
jgi:hypothetical protein